MTYWGGNGGVPGYGTIFSIPVGGGTLTTLFKFDGTHGKNPDESFILSPDGSTLYGTTSVAAPTTTAPFSASLLPEAPPRCCATGKGGHFRGERGPG